MRPRTVGVLVVAVTLVLAGCTASDVEGVMAGSQCNVFQDHVEQVYAEEADGVVTAEDMSCVCSGEVNNESQVYEEIESEYGNYVGAEFSELAFVAISVDHEEFDDPLGGFVHRDSDGEWNQPPMESGETGGMYVFAYREKAEPVVSAVDGCSLSDLGLGSAGS